jgi:DNA-binding IclR family transcriptional regulator
MEKLRTVTGESVNLAILDGNEAVYIEHVESNRTLRTFTTTGNRVPLYSTGIGKVFCAYMDKETVCNMLKEPFSRFTENTIKDLDTLEKELLTVKHEGVALDNGEMEIDVRCIAAPIVDSNKKVIGSVSISGPFTRLTERRIEELKPILKQYAALISSSMGCE